MNTEIICQLILTMLLSLFKLVMFPLNPGIPDLVVMQITNLTKKRFCDIKFSKKVYGQSKIGRESRWSSGNTLTSNSEIGVPILV